MFASLSSLSSLSARSAATFVFALSLATIGSAWAFEAAGYAPCELCLAQRIPYYIAIPFAALLALAAPALPAGLARFGLGLLALLFAGSCVFGLYHAGVEWHFWPGPTACTGGFVSTGDIMEDLKRTKVVQCDVVAIRILGLSLAGWNAVVSAAIAWLAGRGAYPGVMPAH